MDLQRGDTSALDERDDIVPEWALEPAVTKRKARILRPISAEASFAWDDTFDPVLRSSSKGHLPSRDSFFTTDEATPKVGATHVTVGLSFLTQSTRRKPRFTRLCINPVSSAPMPSLEEAKPTTD